MSDFKQNVKELFADYEVLITKKNIPGTAGNRIYRRWNNPVLTAAHTPVFWRFDLNETTNPLLLERQG